MGKRSPMSEIHTLKLGRIEQRSLRNEEDIEKNRKASKANYDAMTLKVEVLEKRQRWLTIVILFSILVNLPKGEATKVLMGVLKALI